MPDGVRAECRAERQRYEDVWRSLVADLSAAGLIDLGVSPDSVRLLLLGAVNWAGEWCRPERMRIDDIARDFDACILRDAPGPTGRKGRSHGA